MAPKPQAVNAADVAAPIGPYVHAVRHGAALYCTGQLPLPPEGGELVPGGPAAQAEQCLENLERVCAAAGTTLANALRVCIYAVDLSAFADVNQVYARRFGDRPPARTTIGVAALPMGAAVEMDAIVALPGESDDG